jgi:hypothetical protein
VCVCVCCVCVCNCVLCVCVTGLVRLSRHTHTHTSEIGALSSRNLFSKSVRLLSRRSSSPSTALSFAVTCVHAIRVCASTKGKAPCCFMLLVMHVVTHLVRDPGYVCVGEEQIWLFEQ